jgi:outer membrane protein assembly factor BamB/tRNA A-37 threonylcarbamoyl transferase component Bud32
MAANLFCPRCGATNTPGSTFCPFCTYDLITVSHHHIKRNALLRQRYQIVEKLGQGGFAAVYKARDIQFPFALRAIKEMNDDQLNAQEKQNAITAFRQEAHILARLMHPNLPRIYDHFEEQQRWYLVMDYIEGETLETLLARSPNGRVPVDKVISYALQLCTVLKYLHDQSPPIIFRDLKPSNIMTARGDHLYLIDFGIARFFQPGKIRDTRALGSLGYAAPEQYGKRQTTALADIYGFGATLHHLLSGRDPSDDPFNFPPLQLEPHDYGTGAIANLVAQMVTIEEDKRPASIEAIEHVLSATSLQRVCATIPPTISSTHDSTLARPSSTQRSPKWVFDAGGDVYSSPTVVDGVVYFGSDSGHLYALEATSGRLMWSFPIDDWVRSSPTIVNGIVYFGSHNQNFYALDARSGRKMWSFRTGDKVYSSPSVVNNVAYFGSADRNLYALGITPSGWKQWSFPTGRGVRSSPAVVNGTVYFGSGDGNFYALEATSGEKQWSFQTGDKVYSSPAVVNDVVYFGSDDGNLHALEAFSGRKKWFFPTSDRVRSSPTVVHGIVYFGSDDGNLYALDTRSGLQRWSFPTGNAVQSSPTVVDGIVYIGSNDGKVYALDAVSKRKLWSFSTGNAVQSSPTVANGVVYVGSDNGYLYAIVA